MSDGSACSLYLFAWDLDLMRRFLTLSPFLTFSNKLITRIQFNQEEYTVEAWDPSTDNNQLCPDPTSSPVMEQLSDNSKRCEIEPESGGMESMATNAGSLDGSKQAESETPNYEKSKKKSKKCCVIL